MLKQKEYDKNHSAKRKVIENMVFVDQIRAEYQMNYLEKDPMI